MVLTLLGHNDETGILLNYKEHQNWAFILSKRAIYVVHIFKNLEAIHIKKWYTCVEGWEVPTCVTRS